MSRLPLNVVKETFFTAESIRKRELIATFPGSGVTTRLPIDTMGDGKNGRGVAEDLLRP
jgi:hypothetical protein